MGDCDLQLATSTIQNSKIANELAIATRLKESLIYILNVDLIDQH
jgi:hypothetical protein